MEENALNTAGSGVSSGGGGGGLASSIIAAVGNVAATVGAIISSKESTKQAGINKEIAALQIEAGASNLDIERQKTLQAQINAKKAELQAVQRSENIKTFTNTAIIFGVLTVASLVAYWTLRPAKPATIAVSPPKV
jgi:hypothetical protein